MWASRVKCPLWTTWYSHEVRIPEKGSLHQANSIHTDPLQGQDRTRPGAVHTDTGSGSFFLFNIPPELGASDLDSFPLILLSGFRYCKGDRGKFLGRSPIFPLFWEVRLKVIRNHFHPPPGDFLTQHILSWPQEVSAPRPDSVSCPHSMKATWITFWNDQSRFPWVHFWRSKTTADYFFSLY